MKMTKQLLIGILVSFVATAAQAQKIILHMSDNQKVEFKVSQLDSITFVDKGSAVIPSFLTCPDNNHPHAIDLGLPSGTKWACCNVGATAPHKFGVRYAWGETSGKTEYSPYNYDYRSPIIGDVNRDYAIDVADAMFSNIDIGSEIGGTDYDAATVNMGAPWRMPSVGQIEELINNCSPQSQYEGEYEGFLITGPNGGHIFLPFTENSYDEYDEYRIVLWSSTLDGPENYSGFLIDAVPMAYVLLSPTDYGPIWGGSLRYRFCGFYVRAVCP